MCALTICAAAEWHDDRTQDMLEVARPARAVHQLKHNIILGSKSFKNAKNCGF